MKIVWDVSFDDYQMPRKFVARLLMYSNFEPSKRLFGKESYSSLNDRE